MPKKALSVTLDAANVAWLKGRAQLSGGNVSDALDKVVTLARTGGGAPPARAADLGVALFDVTYQVLIVVSLLVRAGRGGLKVAPAAFFNTLFLNPCYQAIDLTAEQVFAAEELRINRDPFDGLIAAAAVVLGLPLITRDRDLTASKAVKVIW